MVFGWRKKPKTNAPPPAALNVRHTFVNAKPGSNTVLTQYPTAQPAGKATYATHIGQSPGELWPLGASEQAWAHWDRVPDGADPRVYYARRDSSKNTRNRIETRIGLPLAETAHSPSVRGPDAKWTPPQPSRPTVNSIPVNGHGLWNPLFGHQTAWNSNKGLHSSLALVHRNYPIGGMRPQERARNTLRTIPPSYDATSADVDSAQNYTTLPGIYVSPGAGIPGVAYGLRGGF
jgi:hypothetical protein